MRVLFLQSAHIEKDDRVWYHQRKSLSQHGAQVTVCSTIGQQSWYTKWKMFRQAVRKSQPNVIIADTPFAVLCAGRGKKIIWDITEFYPSKKDLHGSPFEQKIQRCFKTIIAQAAARKSTAFCFGEKEKYSYAGLGKPSINLPYYPDSAYITYTPERDISHHCKLLYAGPKTEDKGWSHVEKVLAICRKQMPEVMWELDNIYQVSYEDFCQRLKDYDIFLDLRKADKENMKCLPIKLFYYMAAGRPSVYSRLAAIENHIPEADNFMQLVNPDKETEAANAIMRYVSTPTLYHQHATTARQLHLTHYNWQQIEKTWLQFIEQ